MSSEFEVLCPAIPAPAEEISSSEGSSLTLGVRNGAGLTLWCGLDAEAETSPVRRIRLAPDQPAVVGRAEGNRVPYLDPTYRATRLVPGTGQDILRSANHRKNYCVSRAHFMLKAAARGVLLVNGVPRTGGGIRAPLNGTRMLSPEARAMNAGEEYLIETGATAVIALPNDSEIEISAE